MDINSIEKVDEYLANIPKFQSEGTAAAKFSLDRLREFCKELGNPQYKFPSIHVAGTNGKGSTCRIMAAVLSKSGRRTGVFTSPHIHRYNERYRINDQEITNKELIHFFQLYGDRVKAYGLSYFEISTALAFWWFAEREVDIALIETGLGGRLDATNVVTPVVSVITSISLDHTDVLGDTIGEIAHEKAGIIKPGTPVVIGSLPDEAAAVISRIAEQKGSPRYTIEDLEPTFIGPGQYELTWGGRTLPIKSNLEIPVQALNLAIALRTLMVPSLTAVTPEQFVRAVRQVDAGAGRFTRLIENQRWFFDGGHNIEAVKALKSAIQTAGDIKAATLVLALMRDKIQPEVMAEFSEFKKIYYYPLDFQRAATFDEIKEWLPKANLFPVEQNQQRLLLKDFDSELVIFAGSFYFYTTVQDLIKNCI